MLAPKLQQFLKLHDESEASHGIKNSLGDSFLYRHNYIFKNIRDCFFKLGFTFTDKDFCHYTVMPYASLKSILKEKKVPYFDNVTVLKEIEQQYPRKFNCHDIVKVKPNYILHESSHCIVESFLKDLQLSTNQLSTESQKAFKLVMAEAFANTVESLANLPNDTVEKRLFFELNSYAIHTKKVNQNIQQTYDLLGPTLIFHLVYVSYLFSNCLFPEPNTKVYQTILELLIPDVSVRKKAFDSQAVRKTFNHAFELSQDFRIQTTSFYLAYSGINGDLFKVLQVDIVELMKKTLFIQNLLKYFDFLFIQKNQ